MELMGMIRRIFFLLLFFSVGVTPKVSKALSDSIEYRLAQLDTPRQIDYLGELCWKLREVDRNQAIACGKFAVSLADSLGYTGKTAKYANFLGVNMLFYQTDIPEAVYYLNKAFKSGMQAHDTAQIGYAYNNLGDVYQLTGNIPLAQMYADSSLNYFRAINDPEGIAYSYLNIANAKMRQKDYQQAMTYFRKAIDLYPEHGAENIVSTANLGLARIYTLLKKYDKALEFYRQDLKLTREIQNKTFEATTLSHIAEVQSLKNQFEKSLANFKLAESLFQERNQRKGLFNVYLGQALVYAHLGNREAGEDALQKALALTQELISPTRTLEVFKTKLKFYSILDLDIASSDIINQYIEIHDSLDLVKQFEILDEISQKQQVMTDLNQAKEEIRAKKRERIYLIVVIGLTLILVGVLIWKNYSMDRLNRELATLNTGKDKLFSIISHDLRNPFIAIIQYLELLKSGELSQEEKKQFFTELETQTNQTYAMLENLLNFSAFRIKKIQSHPRPFSLNKLLRKVKANLQAQLQLKNLHLKSELKQDILYADEKMIEIILRNLISNSIKYSMEGDTIMIKSNSTASEVVISVIDRGKGMTKEEQDHLFTAQFPLSATGTKGEGGTGIGLQICRELISLHKGQLKVESAPGEGTTFHVFLPLQPDKLQEKENGM